MLTKVAGILLTLVVAAAAPPADHAADSVLVESGRGGKYDGVAPGAATKNPLPAAPVPEPPSLIWTGFQMNPAGDGSRVFIQTNKEVQYELAGEALPDAAKGKRAAKKASKSSVSVWLRNCRIHLKNNARNLDTRFFPTPVRGVSTHQHKRDVELRVALKEPVTAVPRTEPGPDGTHFLVLDFPRGAADVAPVPVPKEASGPTPAGGDYGVPANDGAPPPEPATSKVSPRRKAR